MRIVFNHILLVDLVNVENGLRSAISLNLKTNIVLVISCLPKLPVGHDVGIETGDVGNVSELKELLTCRRVNVDVNTAIGFNI